MSVFHLTQAIADTKSGFSVRNKHDGSILCIIQCFQNDAFVDAVQIAGRLIQKHERCIGNKGARQRDALLFAARNRIPQFADTGIVAMGQGGNKIMDRCLFRRSDDFLVRCAQIGNADVVADGIMKQVCFLRTIAFVFTQGFCVDVCDIRSGKQNSATVLIPEAHNKLQKGGFATAAFAENPRDFSCGNFQRKMVENGLCAIAEGNILYFYIVGDNIHAVFLFLRLGCFLQERKHARAARQRLCEIIGKIAQCNHRPIGAHEGYGCNQCLCEINLPRKEEPKGTEQQQQIDLASPATEGSSTGGGGGGGGVTKYAVAVSPTDNGKVTPDKTSAAKGSVVTITAMANDGYALDTIKATDKAGKEIKLTDKGDGKYTFTMPASKVEVKAAFKQTASKPGKPAEEMKTVVVMQVGSKTMFVNGKAYEKDAAPVIMNDRTLVPIRFVTESLGGTVAWNAETKEVTLVIDGKEIKMTIGKTIEKYGVAPVIIDSRTFVPVRFVADELGATTAWNAETKTVTITKAVTPMKTEK